MGVWAAGQVKERERDLRKNALSLINANLLSAVKLLFKFFQPLFHPFVHILNPCYVSATSLGSRKTKGNKTGEDLLRGEWGGAACVKSMGVRGVSRIREGRPERDEAASPAAI